MSKPASFRTVRWVRTLNLLAQAVLFVTLFAGLNYLAIHYAWRFDLTQQHSRSLSPETRSYLKNLNQPVRIVVTLTADNEDENLNQAYRDVSGLLREYVYATEGNEHGRITTEFIDVYQRRRDAEALGITRPNVMLVICGTHVREIEFDTLYSLEGKEKKAFLGEQSFTAAILDVSNGTKKKIYFLTGHGEMQLDDVSATRGLSALDAQLKMRNFDVAPLDLTQFKTIPADAAAIVIAGPQGRYDPIEEEMLRQYLGTRAGRLLALIAPGAQHGLDDLFYDDWGLLVDDVLIYDNGPAGQNETGDLILFPTTTDHPVSRSLVSYKIPLRFGLSRSIRPAPGRTLDTNLMVTPLVVTSESAWGERNYRDRSVAEFTAGVDIPGRLPVVTTSERVTARGNLPFSIPGGRIVAVGSADWISNGRLNVIGNLTLFMSAINWAADRDVDLNIPIRPIARFQLSLSQQQIQRLRFSLVLLLPGVAALIGLIVYWTRRN